MANELQQTLERIINKSNILVEKYHALERTNDEINSEKEDSVRFWRSLGFVENGKDEYDMPLFVKKDCR